MALSAEGDWRMMVEEFLSYVPREAMCILSTDLRIVHVNASWTNLFGHASEEAVGSVRL